jgi:hypothetical protein
VCQQEGCSSLKQHIGDDDDQEQGRYSNFTDSGKEVSGLLVHCHCTLLNAQSPQPPQSAIVKSTKPFRWCVACGRRWLPDESRKLIF